jgi:hypothetical protein
MSIQHAIWKVGDSPTPLAASRLATEQLLEEMIVREPRILSDEWLLIGRQERTPFGGIIDLLALAPDGSLVLIELKRDKTPRDIVAQALDYASWVEQLEAEHIAQMFQRFSPGNNLNDAFRNAFKTELDEDTLNHSHQIIIVASALDAATERIIDYLNAKDIAINAVFFQVFQHGAEQFISRAWMIDPRETQTHVATGVSRSEEKEPWNGEFYVSYGPPTVRSWDDARKYGFVSAGGGAWYTRTLGLLAPGDRIWMSIPGRGYVGVARVLEPMAPVLDFMVTKDGARIPVIEAVANNEYLNESLGDGDAEEHFVRVEWLHSVSINDAVNEVGLFGNQNTVCKPTTPKWRHTVERLKTVFTKWDSR